MSGAAESARRRRVRLAILWRLKMRAKFGFLVVLLLTGSLGIAQQQKYESDACKFNVLGDPVHATVTGPDDIVPMVYVVEQPDSPVEIVSVDLEGMWLSVSGEQHSERDCAQYKVHNRSDRIIQRFDVALMITSTGGGGEIGVNSSSPLAAGQTAEIKACNGGGHGGAPGNHVRLLASVHLVNFGGCLYRPSLRMPRSLGVHPVW
jgi:hypothetical protein